MSTLDAIHQGDTGTFQQGNPGARARRDLELPCRCHQRERERQQGGKEMGTGRRFPLLHPVCFGGAKESGNGVCFCAEHSVYPVAPPDSAGRTWLSGECPELLQGCLAPATAAQLGPHHSIRAAKGSRESAGGPEAFFNVILNLRNTFQQPLEEKMYKGRRSSISR